MGCWLINNGFVFYFGKYSLEARQTVCVCITMLSEGVEEAPQAVHYEVFTRTHNLQVPFFNH